MRCPIAFGSTYATVPPKPFADIDLTSPEEVEQQHAAHWLAAERWLDGKVAEGRVYLLPSEDRYFHRRLKVIERLRAAMPKTMSPADLRAALTRRGLT